MSSRVSIASINSNELVPMTPEEGGWEPLSGDANAMVQTLCENGEIWSGIAILEPCSFHYTAQHPGAIQLLEGEATVAFDGHTRDLAAGSVVYLTQGAETTWVIRTPMKEFFIAHLGGV